MAEGVIRRHLNTKALFQFEDIPSRICDGKKCGDVIIFVSLLRFCPLSTIPYTLCIRLHLMSLITEEKIL